MATNPKLPPTEPLEEKPGESAPARHKPSPWPLVIGIILVVCFGLLAAFLFR